MAHAPECLPKFGKVRPEAADATSDWLIDWIYDATPFKVRSSHVKFEKTNRALIDTIDLKCNSNVPG